MPDPIEITDEEPHDPTRKEKTRVEAPLAASPAVAVAQEAAVAPAAAVAASPAVAVAQERAEQPMSDLIEITDEERVQLEHAAELLEGALSSPTGWINSTAMLAYDTLRSLATRKPVEPRVTDPRIIMLSDEPRPFKADPAPDAEEERDTRADTLSEAADPQRPVGDGEVVVRLTREEAQVLVGRAELALEETSWGYAALDESVRTPLGDKLRAALDQGGSDG